MRKQDKQSISQPGLAGLIHTLTQVTEPLGLFPQTYNEVITPANLAADGWEGRVQPALAPCSRKPLYEAPEPISKTVTPVTAGLA